MILHKLRARSTGHLFVAAVAIAARAEYSQQVGILCLFGTFIANGTHSVFAKIAGKDAAPIVYTLYLACGLFLGSSIAVASMSEPFEISGPGLLGGMLFSVAVTCYVNAIFLVGIVWCDMLTASAATLTSFLWGKLCFKEPSNNLYGALVGLALLLLGIAGLSAILSLRLKTLDQSQRIAGGSALARGLFLSVFNGVCGGSCFAVNKLQPSDKQGISFVWAQAVGMLTVQALFMLLALCSDVFVDSSLALKKAQYLEVESSSVQQTFVLGRFWPSRLGPLGFMQGLVFAIANLTLTVAALSPIGIGVAQPVREAGHSLAVLIGILVFQEYGTPDMYFVGSLLVPTIVNIAGIVVLTKYGSAPTYD